MGSKQETWVGFQRWSHAHTQGLKRRMCARGGAHSGGRARHHVMASARGMARAALAVDSRPGLAGRAGDAKRLWPRHEAVGSSRIGGSRLGLDQLNPLGKGHVRVVGPGRGLRMALHRHGAQPRVEHAGAGPVVQVDEADLQRGGAGADSEQSGHVTGQVRGRRTRGLGRAGHAEPAQAPARRWEPGSGGRGGRAGKPRLTSTSDGSVAVSTAKLWFCELISMRPAAARTAGGAGPAVGARQDHARTACCRLAPGSAEQGAAAEAP